MSLDYIKLESGAPTRTRTADLLITNQLLYQLSYRGTWADLRARCVWCKPENNETKQSKIMTSSVASCQQQHCQHTDTNHQ